MKTGHRKTTKLKHRKEPTAARSQAAADLQEQLDRRTRELAEALEQQTATGEILRIISASPTDLRRVLEVVVKSAARFCDADDVTIFELEGQDLRAAAHWGAIPQDLGVRFPCSRGHVAGRAVLDRRPFHVIDLQAEAEEFPEGSAFAKRLGHRTTASVPLLREGVTVGAITLRRAEVNPFTEKQIALLKIFADQAVIAIENARLFEAEQQRRRELSESLQQQTATADVLKVISRSTFDLQSVLDTLVQSAAQLCEADLVTIWRPKGTTFHVAATYRTTPTHDQYLANLSIEPGRHSCVARTLLEAQVVHIPDIREDDEYAPELKHFGAREGYRTMLGVPLLREGTPIGVIALIRCAVYPFTDKQIELVTTFADQAGIAIENVRRNAAGGCGGAEAGHRAARPRAWRGPPPTRLDQRHSRSVQN